MKVKRYKKIFLAAALALSVCLVTVLPGCGESGQDEIVSQETSGEETAAVQMTADAEEGEAAAEMTQAEDVYGRYSEPVQISILGTDAGKASIEYDSADPERKSASENVWIDAYRDYLNLEVERLIAEDDTALNATINTSMASGDLPDVMIVPKETLYTLAQNEVLQDLRPAYEEYASAQGTLLKTAVDGMPSALDAGTIDGELLGFPIIPSAYNSTESLWIRQDWLDQVGMDAPKTLDEMKEVARAFMENRLGGEDTIGLGLAATKENLQPYRSLLAPFGVVYNVWTENEEGTYEYSMVSDEMKEALLFMQELYSEGLVKSDFAVTDILGEEVANGKVGMYYGEGWRGATDVKASLVNDENADWIAVPIPTQDGELVKQWTNSGISYFAVATKECEHPEAIMKMIELELHMYYEPTDEEQLKYVVCEDNYPVWNFRIFRNFNYADLAIRQCELIMDAVEKELPLEEMPLIARTQYQQVLNGLDGDRSQLGYVAVYTEGYKNIMDSLNADMLVGEYDGPITENMSLYLNTINAALTSECMKVVMGADISVFEQAVEAWYQNGGQAITDEINAYYASMNG